MITNRLQERESKIRPIWLILSAIIINLVLSGCTNRYKDNNDITLELRDSSLVFKKVTSKKFLYMMSSEVTNKMYFNFLQLTGKKKEDHKILELILQQEGKVLNEFDDDNSDDEILSKKIVTPSTANPVYEIKNKQLLWKNNRYPSGQENYPVTLITIKEANDFCRWLNTKYSELGRFRLPTFDEWLQAAYGSERKYPWGDEWNEQNLCFKSESPESVTSRKSGVTLEGLYGMWGNVNEYVIDNLKDKEDQEWALSMDVRWLGGSFRDEMFKPRQSYWGYWHDGNSRSETVGFRVVLEASTSKYTHPK